MEETANRNPGEKELLGRPEHRRWDNFKTDNK
jgi:hypothetical protein